MKNSTDIEIRIPASISTLPLSLAEKLVLAHIAINPDCTNDELSKILGITDRGIKKLLRRLRSAGYIDQNRKGRARRLYLKVLQGTGNRVPLIVSG